MSSTFDHLFHFLFLTHISIHFYSLFISTVYFLLNSGREENWNRLFAHVYICPLSIISNSQPLWWMRWTTHCYSSKIFYYLEKWNLNSCLMITVLWLEGVRDEERHQPQWFFYEQLKASFWYFYDEILSWNSFWYFYAVCELIVGVLI